MGVRHTSDTFSGILKWSLLSGVVYTALSPQLCRLTLLPNRIDSRDGLIVCPYLECCYYRSSPGDTAAKY